MVLDSTVVETQKCQARMNASYLLQRIKFEEVTTICHFVTF